MTTINASPIVMVKKKDGSNRCACVDFRKFSKITEIDPELVTMDVDLLCRLGGKIDFTKGYWCMADTGCSK